MQISHGALLRVADEAGTPVPIGSTATQHVAGAAVLVGYAGNAYVQGLDLNNEHDVERPDGRRCSVAFDYRPVPGDIPTIPLTCREQRP
jgi:outer membrane usher protein